MMTLRALRQFNSDNGGPEVVGGGGESKSDSANAQFTLTVAAGGPMDCADVVYLPCCSSTLNCCFLFPLRFYLIAGGVPLIICGITAAVNVNNYGDNSP